MWSWLARLRALLDVSGSLADARLEELGLEIGLLERCPVCQAVTEKRLSGTSMQTILNRLLDDCRHSGSPVEGIDDCQALVLAMSTHAADAPLLCDCEEL